MAMTSLIDRILALPGELQNSILSFCTDNDLVCLSLTNKSLYSLYSGPKPVALYTNQMLAARPPSEVLPTHHPCYMNPWDVIKQSPGFYKNLCRTKECFHDEKFDCELWLRLRDWMPKDTRYCRECRRFTKRDKRRRKGACNCTRPARRIPNNNWTYKKHRGFHSDFWKVYYTEANLAMLIQRYTEPRRNRSSYGLRERTKPSQKLLDHTSHYQYTQSRDGGLHRFDFT